MNWTFVQILSHRFPLIAWNNINIAANRNQLPLRTVQICLKNTFAINLTCQYDFLQIRAQQSAYDMNWHDGGTLHAGFSGRKLPMTSQVLPSGTRKEILYVPFWIISFFQVKFNETLRLRMILIGSKWTLTATSGYQLSTPRRN